MRSVVNPEATEAELDDMVESGNPGQIFSQELLSTRSQHARLAFKNVTDRLDDLKKVYQEIRVLTDMFGELQMLVEKQQPVITQIEQNAVQTVENIHEATEQIKEATELRKKSRKVCHPILQDNRWLIRLRRNT